MAASERQNRGKQAFERGVVRLIVDAEGFVWPSFEYRKAVGSTDRPQWDRRHIMCLSPLGGLALSITEEGAMRSSDQPA
jgi:hypothetical protein